MDKFAPLIGTFITCFLPIIVCWQSDSDRVLLKDLNVITLYHGRMTKAGRSPPIPQMKCVGGSAGCDSFTPQVVQCYNRGSDGYDVQWECKTDMDNAYRFGSVEVSCEGYEYPDDPSILRGSCGLEYTLDLTKEGHAQKKQGHHHDYYGDHQDNGNYQTKSNYKNSSSWLGNLLTLGVCCIIVYAIYVTCLSNTGHSRDMPHGNQQGHRSDAPPPYGFRDDYTPGGGCSSTYGSTYNTGATPNTGSTGGGFWGGAATGGLLGYMFGSRGNTGQYGYQRPRYGGSTWGGSNWGGGSGFSSGSSGSSSGTRTASGFGGTKRR